jgi:hypothetical protein
MYRLKRNCLLFLVLVVVGTGLHAQTSSFNFSAGSNPVSGWINVAGNPLAAACTATDPATGFQISSISAANWYNSGSGGSVAFDGGGQLNGTFFPAAVMVNEWFQYDPHGSGISHYSAAVPQLLLSGLNPDTVYTLRMTGSLRFYFVGTYQQNPISYTVTGALVNGPIFVNGDSNTANGATFQNVKPNASGQINIYVNTYGSADMASINGVQIITGRIVTPAPSVAITRPLNHSILPEDGNVLINVTATDSVSTVSRVEFYLGTTLLGADSTAPYSYNWVNPDPGTYSVTARAIDALGYSASTSVNFTVESLNYFWSTTGNIATGGDTSFIGTVDTNRLAFRTHNIERMSILGDGTIGIGTKDTKGYALAVNGTAIFTKVKVKPIGTWPDYVFRKDFHLPGLPELERYVREHQHLPGIASEEEVKAGGIDVSEQEAALLKKVEELTLYLIEQNKKLETQQNTLEAQQKALKAQQKEIDALKALIGEKNKQH